jgi:hypothetical protein
MNGKIAADQFMQRAFENQQEYIRQQERFINDSVQRPARPPSAERHEAMELDRIEEVEWRGLISGSIS